jgi:hypothetical protein
VKAVINPSASQKLDFVKRRTGLAARIRRFRKIQGTYMPGLRASLTQDQTVIYDRPSLPEETRLFLPSDLTDAVTRKAVCFPGLAEVEAEYREAEAFDALERIRHALRSRTMMNRFRIRSNGGQRALTRSQGIFRLIHVRLHISKLRYRYARNALLKLKGHGGWEQTLQILKDDDLRALNERAMTEEEKAREALLEEAAVEAVHGVAAAGAVAAGEGSRTLSWIWYRAKVGESEKEDDPQIEEGKLFTFFN